MCISSTKVRGKRVVIKWILIALGIGDICLYDNIKEQFCGSKSMGRSTYTPIVVGGSRM